MPPSAETSDTYTYDPDDPTPSVKDLDELEETHRRDFDIAWRLARDDVLVYTSEPLDSALQITGTPELVLYATSDQVDTAWHAHLCEVYPDGRSEELAFAVLRAAYRKGREHLPSPIEPGTVVRYDLEFTSLSNVWRKGQRVRLVIASADHPLWARNPNTNAPTGDDEVCLVAHNSVHHRPAAASHLRLPVIEPDEGGTLGADTPRTYAAD